jgi:hypothetical protein
VLDSNIQKDRRERGNHLLCGRHKKVPYRLQHDFPKSLLPGNTIAAVPTKPGPEHTVPVIHEYCLECRYITTAGIVHLAVLVISNEITEKNFITTVK